MKSKDYPTNEEPSPENIVGYRLLPDPLVNIHQARRGIRALASRTWGEHHRFLAGKLLEPDEREVYRLRLQSAGVFAVDRLAVTARNPTCIVTDRRMMAQDDRGHVIQIRRSDIRAISVQRRDDPRTGPSYFVAIGRVGSAVHDTCGDISLYCRTRVECEELAAAIG